MLVRLDGREVRSVVGGRYAVLDDVPTFTRIARAIDSMGWRNDLVVRLVATTDATTVVRLTLRRSRVEIRPDDEFERGIEIANSETGRSALMLTPITFRLGCFNFSRSSRPTLRLVHAGAALRRVQRDLRKDIAQALDAARSLLDGWRSSPSFDAANAITDAAKSSGSLACRIAEERRAQRLVEDAGHHF